MRFAGIVFASLVAFLLAYTQVSGVQAGERYSKQKVVYHINYNGGQDDKVYQGALRNIQNHINAVGAKNLDLKVVLHGNGVGLLQHAKQAGKLQTAVANLKAQNIKFQVCANTLKGRKISMDNLYE
ncbi:MAG: DsrE family protein, partial [Rhodospirillaceae bacterium]